MRVAVALAAAGGLVVAVAGCGGATRPAAVSSSSPRPSATHRVTPTPTPRRHHHRHPTPAPTPKPSPTRSSPAAPAVAICQPRDFAASFTDEQGGVGHLGEVLVLRNRSGRACSVYGYAGMALLNGKHRPMPTDVVRGGGYLFTDPGPVQIIVAAGTAVSAGVEWDHIPGPGEGSSCPMSSYLEVTPPNDFTHLVLAAQIQACNHGRLNETALVPGAGGPKP